MTNIPPDVSVLIPAYNAERWIDDCLNSVTAQNVHDIEIVVIDDGSTDQTSALLSKWSARDDRIRVARNEANCGVARCRNQGLEMCRSGLVALIDADDRMLAHRLGKQLKFMQDNPDVHILGSWAEIIDLSGNPTTIRRMPEKHQDILRVIWANPIMQPTVMYRRSAILAAGGYANEVRGEDYDLWFRCAEAGLTFHNIPEPLTQYRHDHESFARYDLRAALRQFRIGLRGCWRLKVGLRGYAGLLVPLIRSVLPVGLRKTFYGLAQRFDPRGNDATPTAGRDRC